LSIYLAATPSWKEHTLQVSLDVVQSPVPWNEKQLEGCHYSPDVDVIAAAETWKDGQISEFFLFGLQS
jgi:hypothetical protein